MAILKPLKVNLDAIDLDTMELFEAVQDELATTGRVKASVFKRLIAGLFEEWTAEMAGKITRAEMPKIIEAIGEVFNNAVPLESAEN